jgi:hypothetical protein
MTNLSTRCGLAPIILTSTILLAMIARPCIAAPNSYECTVSSEFSLSEDGYLNDPDLEIYTGTQFFVDRKSGIVQGNRISNSNFPTKEVLDPGSDYSGYKLIWISKDLGFSTKIHTVHYLRVEELVESYLKPFILIYMGRIVAGTCA